IAAMADCASNTGRNFQRVASHALYSPQGAETRTSVRQVGSGGHIMKTAITSAILAASLALAPLPASAHERVGDAAIGAAAGAVVLGPVGAVAGGVIGYTAGPGIANEWGLRHRPYRHHRAKVRKN